MSRLIRLLWYVRPYWLQLFASVVLFALVGLLEAFRIALLRPIFDHVFAQEQSGGMALFKIPRTHYTVYLEQLVPGHFHSPWTLVAISLVASVFLKGIFDYLGTYLVNYAGFGLITDLRNDIYERRSFKSIPPARWFRRSSMTSIRSSSPCRAFWRSFFSSFSSSPSMLRW
jgi:subfamily B ATP-binding cassette protein MsbA